MSNDFICLLVDNSNTRTKFVLSGAVHDGEIRYLPTADITEESVVATVSGWSFDRVCLCSVVPWAAQRIVSAFAPLPVDMLGARNVAGVDFSDYPEVETLGADRIANVLAAVRCSPLPLVAVDLGTATTLDVVVERNGQPHFLGGLIAPGYSAMATSLRNNTALLPECALVSEPAVIGRSTQEAMGSALYIGYPGMLDSLLDAINAELGENMSVVLTGGDAELVAPRLRWKCRIEPRLTLQGIALAAGFAF